MLSAALLTVSADAGARRASAQSAVPVTRRAIVASDGVMRWSDTQEELRLFGANYTIGSSGDYRAAGAVGGDRKRMIDEDVAHFARMGWNGMRLAFWGDWQSADRAGNLLQTDYLDLLDYLVARARDRGISILFNPIHTYHAGWPDALRDTFPGFAARVPRERLGTDSAAIAAQVNYLRQILGHVNPYTGVALGKEPAIVMIEMINEPVHHPDDLAGSVRYIDRLVEAVRAAGSDAITFHNVSQDFRIAEAIRRSRVEGASFGWYPTGLVAGHELRGNFLRTVDEYPAMRMSELAGRPRIVYEFDSADLQSGDMYPAMVRTMREGGVQLAAMFAYDMLATASRNLGWQTHRLNLVYTPRKALSAVIAAEAMRRLPSGARYGAYPANRSFGPFRVSHEDNLSEMVTSDAYLNAGATRTAPPNPAMLRRVAGYGSSPVVMYEGEGAYFLDRVRAGVWRLELYPDAVDVDDPFETPNRDRIVTRAIHRAWPMTISLPDLGPAFSVQAITRVHATPARAVQGRVSLLPGVYVLSARGPVNRSTLPERIANLDFAEFHAPPTDSLETRVLVSGAPQFVTGRTVEIDARVVSESVPDSVRLWMRPLGRSWFTAYPMRRTSAYGYRATVQGDSLREGRHEYMVSVRQGTFTITYPERVPREPRAWDFHADTTWRMMIVGPRVPLRLLVPAEDASRLAFTRIGDAIREGIFRVVPSGESGEPVLHMALPVAANTGESPDDYTASLVVADRIRSRGETIAAATAVRIRLRGVGSQQRMHLTMMERDGTSWSTAIASDTGWVEKSIPLSEFRVARGVKLPLGYPGRWNYWVSPAAGRGGRGDSLQLALVERLQLSLRSEPGARGRPGVQAVEVESVSLVFE